MLRVTRAFSIGFGLRAYYERSFRYVGALAGTQSAGDDLRGSPLFGVLEVVLATDAGDRRWQKCTVTRGKMSGICRVLRDLFVGPAIFRECQEGDSI